MAPKVSILLPTHNKADLLSFAIHSVLSQSFQDFEVLVVGDGCSDHTAEIVRRFNDARLIWYDLPKAPNFGYANRNAALRDAKGELIAFMAHDDLWLSDHLENFIPAFNNPHVEIAYTRPLWVIPKGMIVPGFFNLEHKPTMVLFLETENRIPAGCVVHRRDSLFKYGYWNDQLPEAADWDMWKRIIKGGGRMNFAYLEIPTCLHFKAHWHDDNYDRAFHFPEWERLFNNGEMPTPLKVKIPDDKTEQEAIWTQMSESPSKWNETIRSAIIQVCDLVALKGISYSSEVDLLQNEILAMKNTLTWKIHEKIAKIQWIQKIYLGLKSTFGRMRM